jgi:5,10-methylenetetrahydromethanopterin reductase
MSSRHPRREVWASGFVDLKEVAARASWYERAGFDGMTIVDTQCIAHDPYVTLTLAANATSSLQLATGVTNPYTRHPSVTACAITTLQCVTNGRCVLGIGRGDSALAHLGLAPAPPAVFEHYLSRLQRYLAGDEVSFNEEQAPATMRPLETLGLAGAPSSSRLSWITPSEKKVPLDVAAAGPRVIAIGARLAERVTFAVNADPGRISWAIDVATASAEEAGRDPGEVSLGAYVTVCPHKDRSRARDLVAGALASKSRFAVMHGTPQGPTSAATAAVLRRIHASYDMRGHANSPNARAAALTPDYIDESAIIGEVDECVEKLQALFDLGLDRLVVGGPSPDADRSEIDDVWSTIAIEVLTKVRAEVALPPMS